MPSRRAVLLGGIGAATAGSVAAGVAVLAAVRDGGDGGGEGGAGTVPDIRPASVEKGTFVSARRGGLATGFRVITPDGDRTGLPVVVALHGRGSDSRTLVGPGFRIETFLEAHVGSGGHPFAIAA